jgi:hypothetical protein
MSAQMIDRRQLLRGAGVALALPGLEAFEPRTAQAQGLDPPRRYVALYFPNGTAAFWRPTGQGTGDSWKLSPILEPLAPVKPYLSVLQNVSNYTPFGGHVEPSHSNLGAATWTCVRPGGDRHVNSGVSVDQVIATLIGGNTTLPSLQVGLSTLDSYTDGLPAQHSRSISWKSPTEPLYKTINPQAVFDRLVAGGGMPKGNLSPPSDPAAIRRRALRKSALDYLLGNAASLQKKLGASDRLKLDEYLTSVRSLERRVAAPEMAIPAAACTMTARPTSTAAVGNVPPDYNRDQHANVMIDLVVMALRCDLTRVVSFMLDDARSDYVYGFLPQRKFTDAGSTAGPGTVAGYHGLQHAGDRNDGFATIGWWNAQKAALLAGKLAAIADGTNGNMLENTVITFLSGMHGGNHDAGDLPLVLIGGGGKVGSKTVLKTNSYFNFAAEQRLANVHLTVLQKVFGSKDPAFGASDGIIPELLT